MDATLREYNSPIGGLLLGASEQGLCVCDWADSKVHNTIMRRLKRNNIQVSADSALLDLACLQLDEYFEGKRREFAVPLYPVGTGFQKRVWECLSKLHFGETVSYGEIAERIGKPSAVRAVAGAIGNNPLSVFIPCHRVIGKDGSLTGYAGGVGRKEILLNLETMEGVS